MIPIGRGIKDSSRWGWKCVLSVVMVVALPAVLCAQDRASDAKEALARSINWQKGPCKGNLGGYAEITVPEGFVFAGPADAQKYMELNENIPDPTTMGVLQPMSPEESWFLVFEYHDTGHVPDDEKATIDADALLRQKKDAEVGANEERRRRGYGVMHCKDWLIRPAYDTDTKSLAWALRLEADNGAGGVAEVCNYNLRILGRTGVMSTTLVCDPAEITGLVPRVKGLLKGYDYVPGQRYGEWKAGDKVAA